MSIWATDSCSLSIGSSGCGWWPCLGPHGWQGRSLSQGSGLGCMTARLGLSLCADVVVWQGSLGLQMARTTGPSGSVG